MARTISLRSTKEAALYFEHVLPLDSVSAASGIVTKQDFYNDCVPYEDKELALRVVKSLVLKSKAPSKLIHELLGLQLGIMHSYDGAKLDPSDGGQMQMLREMIAHLNREYRIGLSVFDFSGSREVAKRKINAVVSEHLIGMGYGNCSTWGIDEDSITLALLEGMQQSGGSAQFQTTISGLNLVNASSLSWEEIIEFRKDDDSLKALRDLRLFFAENFEGKDRSYISDKLMQLMDKQDAVSKLWKFETAQKSMSVAFSNQSAIMSSVTGLAAAFGGAPLSVIAGAALAFPMGACVLEFGKVFIDSEKEKVDRPTRFLTKLRELGK